MAPAAVEAEFPVVDVVGPMAVGTAAAQPGLRSKGSAVTTVAADFEVCALQGEVRLPVMVKLPLQPVDRVVAKGAVLREAILVRVRFAMAFGAVRGRVAEDMRLVARVALLVRVRAQ